ncbi:GntR family transcriptional regulator [Marinitenerispora sediminis]|uniref:GntR family transcriptional regulator n=1 Tax=Marinitenerispora sediminis TaxID=1931232 RepID=A0A368TAD5_9ACTN|nr:GntR family transcriptional regulator [Marinitenerispora sediminis]RCV52894.1 GntR family transcriptional regulator [Marinitenerispora sediminis]RCV60712.1 GntR family transcriptional regulator [Marinitenerispora sediminis]RCV61573.1 GntR family transcriptional regulator [Marinitenerispora sediminis]
MSSSPHRPEPPYRQIVAEIRARIAAGDLRPGDRMPSIRQIAQRWGVAVATATRVMATLRDEGLVEPKVGSGTVVSARAVPKRPGGPGVPPRPRQPRAAGRALTRTRVLRTAIAIADVEGLDAVSMRRLAAEFGVGPMSLYRHVANKDELVAHMVDEAFGELRLPVPGPEGWRAKLELISREQWQLCRRHLWLPGAVPFTRPLLVPNLTAHTEWTLRALDGLGLPMETRIREALTLHGLVLTVALSMADEAEAEQETGVTLDRWRQAQRKRTDELLAGGRFPLLAAVPADAVSDLDGLFEYGLARHLDGFTALVADGRGLSA